MRCDETSFFKSSHLEMKPISDAGTTDILQPIGDTGINDVQRSISYGDADDTQLGKSLVDHGGVTYRSNDTVKNL